MKYDVLYNFISPITGKIKIDSGYILIGDKNGFSSSSPILIDIRQDIIDLRRNLDRFQRLDKLDHNRIWIGDYENEPEERLQIGIINLPILSEALFPNPLSPIIGDFRIPNPTFDYLSPFDWVMSGPFLPQIYATKYDTLGNPVGTDVSSSLAMTQVRAAQIMKRFDNANFIVGSSTVEFSWENPKMYLIPETLKQLYGLGTSYTFTKAQSLGALETGLLKNTVNNSSGTLSRAIAGKDYVDVSAPIANMQLALIRPLLEDQGQDISKLISRIDKLPLNNLTNLSAKAFWQGDGSDISRPVEFLFSSLGIGILKVNVKGDLDLAVGGIDYPSIASVTAAQTTADAAAAAAAAAPAEGAALAAIYFNAQMLPYSAIPGITAGFSISAALATVTAAAASAQSTANTAVNLINTVKIEGDVIGVNNSNTNIIKSTFTPNPVFTGNEAMTIPSGFTSQRPVNAVSGMLRFNKEIQ
jgi:hypothetical protein